MNAWQPLVHEYALTPSIPPAATGKNATDMKLAIEAMDCCIAGRSRLLHRVSDSDFTTLASRIREDGVSVYGFGEQKASTAYVVRATVLLLRLLIDEEKGGRGKTANMQTAVDDILPHRRLSAKGWAHLGSGQILTNAAGFRPAQLRLQELSSLVESMKSVEVRREDGGAVEVGSNGTD